MTPTPISLEDFQAAEKEMPDYYAGRWRAYYARCLQMVAGLKPESVLEIGPYKLPLFRGSQTLDLREEVNPTFPIDARETPWPIADGAFDLVVALHVWEHFGDAQQDAFREVARIARYALLAFPYRWNVPDRPDHHDIDLELIDLWCCGTRPIAQELRGSAQRRRVIRLFDFRDPSHGRGAI